MCRNMNRFGGRDLSLRAFEGKTRVAEHHLQLSDRHEPITALTRGRIKGAVLYHVMLES